MYILYIILTLSFYLYFFKFIRRRNIVFINGTQRNVNNNNSNSNNNNNNNNNNINDNNINSNMF